MTRPTLDMRMIRAAATDAGNRYMRQHPEARPDGSAVWTREALDAATAEFHRLCRAAGISPHTLPNR
jgi:hypothetical protein